MASNYQTAAAAASAKPVPYVSGGATAASASNGKPPLLEPSSVGATTASLEAMTLGSPRQNGGPASSSAAAAAPASPRSPVSLDSPIPNGTDGAGAPLRLDPRSVAAHVFLPGDELAPRPPSGHSLTDLVMGKTLGRCTNLLLHTDDRASELNVHSAGFGR